MMAAADPPDQMVPIGQKSEQNNIRRACCYRVQGGDRFAISLTHSSTNALRVKLNPSRSRADAVRPLLHPIAHRVRPSL